MEIMKLINNNIIQRIVSIDLDDKFTKIGIIDSILGYRNIRYLKSIDNKEITNSSDNYIESLTKYINKIISKYITPFTGLAFTIQNEDIIIRNIKIIKPEKEQDIKYLIKYELKKFMPINLDNYIIKYNIISILENEIDIQTILFPKANIELCKKVAKSLKIKPKKICVNFNILQNLISKNIIDIDDGENLILEIKDNIINLNVIKDKHIIESYSLKKDGNLKRYIESKLDSLNRIYIYGKNDDIVIKMISNIINVEHLEISKLNIKNENNYILNEFINNIGMAY
jgi:type IV pilus assembly protein PilM